MDSYDIEIIYATQTGCAKEVAERIYREGKRRWLKLKLTDIEFFDLQTWFESQDEKMVIIVISTTGQGDMPDSMRLTIIQPPILRKVKYCVFGLGDSSYSQFNYAAKKIWNRLKNLGAVPFYLRGEGDDQHPLGLEGALDPWLKGLWKITDKLFPLEEGKEIIPSNILPQPRYKIITKNNLNNNQNNLENNNNFKYNQNNFKINETKKNKFEEKEYSRNNPFNSEIIFNKKITKNICAQDVRHISMKFPSSGFSEKPDYESGDIVKIFPRNLKEWVNQFFEILKYDENLWIEDLIPNDQNEQIPILLRKKLPCTLRELATSYFDILGTPKRYFFELLSFFETEELQKEKLNFFASTEGQDELRWYNHKEHRTPLQIFLDFPTARPPLEYIFDFFPPLQPRAFWICSSQKLNPNEIHITIAVVSFKTLYGRTRKGVCSNYLSTLKKNDKIEIFVQDGFIKLFKNFNFNHFSLPPLIFVGPGTGCAIFRSILQEIYYFKKKLKVKQEKKEENEKEEEEEDNENFEITDIAFFFGNRHKEQDFLFEDEWNFFLEKNILTLFDPAFSQDQENKIYVYHKIKKNEQKILEMIQNGAMIIVSGNAQQMPKDVKSTFEEIVGKEHISLMVKKGFYKEDVWF